MCPVCWATLLHGVLLGLEKNSQGTVGMVNTEKHHTIKNNSSEKSVWHEVIFWEMLCEIRPKSNVHSSKHLHPTPVTPVPLQ